MVKGAGPGVGKWVWPPPKKNLLTSKEMTLILIHLEKILRETNFLLLHRKAVGPKGLLGDGCKAQRLKAFCVSKRD